MRDVTNANFGLLIAYVIPGFVLVWGLQPYSAKVTVWLGQSPSEAAAAAGFLFTTIVAVGLGVLSSTVRWLSIDRIFLRRRGPVQQWDFRRLDHHLSAFDRLIEDHFRYYQFHANSLISVNMTALMLWTANGVQLTEFVAVALVDTLLYVGAADTFTKYHDRVDQVLGSEESAFSNGKELPDLDF